MKQNSIHFKPGILFLLSCLNTIPVTAEEMLIIDDRQNNGLTSNIGSDWRMVADNVMGGVSSGSLATDVIHGKACLHLRGSVSLENNGGFIQAALDIDRSTASAASAYRGVMLEVYGNNEPYNLHLRTADLVLPWQSYRATFDAPSEWRTLKLPFDSFTAYRTNQTLDLSRLRRIGIVAIGRAFTADLCIARLAYY